MKLSLFGLSHKTAPVQLRERFAFKEDVLPQALQELTRLGAAEAVIVSTCNRVEIAVTSHGDDHPGGIVEQFIETWKGPASAFDGHLYRKHHEEAIHHLFRVASSLDSMVVGEPQILGQMKAAYAIAKAEGTVGGLLENVIMHAFGVAKRVRTETGIGEMAVSVSYAAVELARQIFGSLKGQSVMIIGSGKMGELAARHLRRSGASNIFVTNRTWERAQEFAHIFDGTAIEYDRFKTMLHEVDIVIASSGAPHYLLLPEDMRRVIAQRKNRPVFLIDIAVPRNIDPECNKVEGVFLYDVDDLEGVVNANLKERARQAIDAEKIVTDEVRRMVSRMKIEQVAPTIVSLQGQLEEIRTGEMLKTIRRLHGLAPEQLAAVEAAMDAMSKSIVNKIAHGPISELRRNAGEPDGDQVIEAIRKVFHLQN